MKDERKTKKELVEEIKSLRNRLKILEKAERHRTEVEEELQRSKGSIRTADGLPQQILGTGLDITESKKAEDRIKAAEARYRELAETLPDVIFEVDNKGIIKYVNEIAYETFKYTREDMKKGIPALQVIAEEDHERVAGAISKMMTGKSTGAAREYLARRKDGTTFPCIVTTILLKDEEGKPAGIRGILKDITERKRAEEAISKAQKQWERTFDAIPDLIAILDTRYRIVQVNRAFADRVGVAPDRCQGEHCYALIHGTSEPPSFCPHTKLMQDGREHTLEIHEPRLTSDFLVTASPLLDDRGQITGCVHIARDITERKRMEEEILKSRKLESVGILARGIAHDFNNLLAGILGYISLSKIYVTDEKVLKWLSNAEGACDYAKDLIHRLITFAKGGEPLIKTISLPGMLKEIVESSLSGSHITPEFAFPDDLYPVTIDEGQILHAIRNIVLNAKEAMPEGGVLKVHAENITLTKEDALPLKEGNYVKVSIRDNGKGIPEEYLSNIFDPYFTTKQMGSDKGTGLGLSISYTIIKRHEGHMTVESKEGSGTTLFIYLPASQDKG